MGDSVQTGRSSKLHYYSAEKPYYNSHNRVRELAVAAHKSCRNLFVGCLYSRFAVLIDVFCFTLFVMENHTKYIYPNVDARE